MKNKKKEKKHRGLKALLVIILIFIAGMYAGQHSGIDLPDYGIIDLGSEYAGRLVEQIEIKASSLTGKETKEKESYTWNPEEQSQWKLPEAEGVDYKVNRILYEDLSDNGKFIYRAFYKAALSHKDKIFIPTVSEDELKEVHSALIYDNPQIPCFGDKFTYSPLGKISYVKLNYSYTAAACKEISEQMLLRAKEITEACADSDDYEKELYIHDFIVNESYYSDEENSAHCASGVLLDKKGVCTSYALAMKMMLDMSGIESFVIQGEAEGDGKLSPHAWLGVRIGDNWYQTDPVWDDPTSTDGENILVHTYFNITTDRMNADHSSYKLPGGIKCEADEYNYFIRSGRYCCSYDWYDVMLTAFRNDITGTVTELEFMFDNEKVYNEAVKELNSGTLNRMIQTAVTENGIGSLSWSTATRMFEKPCAAHYIITLN